MTTTRVISTPDGFVEPEAIAAHRSSAQDIPDNEPRSRVYDGATRITVGQEGPQQTGIARHAHTIDGVIGGSVLATRAKVNGAETVELIPGSSASRTLLATAVRDGLVRQVAAGVYEDVRTSDGTQRTHQHVEHEEAHAAQQREQQQANESVAATAGVFLPAEDAHFASIATDIPEHVFRSTAAAITNAVVLDQSLEVAATRLAKEAGIEPVDAMEKVATLVELQQRVVDRAMAKVGLQGDDLAAFYEYAMSQPNRLQNCLQYLVAARDVSEFQRFGREFAEKQGLRAVVEQARSASIDELANPTPQRSSQAAKSSGGGQRAAVFEAAGFETSRDAAGTLVVRQGGGSWQPATAVLNPAATAATVPTRRAPTSREAIAAAARLQHTREDQARILRGSGFEVSADSSGNVIARKGHGAWRHAADIYGKT